MSDSVQKFEENGEGGFVIVGVVMFVLALTILGLSLFSLSSFESQFMTRSLSDEQAFSAACSGVERVKFRLGQTGAMLLSASSVNGMEGVTKAVAYQLKGSDLDSVGAVDPNGAPVEIRVWATIKGANQLIQGLYDPTSTQDYYRRLISSSGGITANPDASRKLSLGGDVWQNIPDLSWQAHAAPYTFTAKTSAGVPIPDVQNFLDSAPPAENFTEVPSGGNDHFYLDTGLSGAVKFYRYIGGYATGGWSYNNATHAVIHVKGYAVWLADYGVFEYSLFDVQGSSAADALIIVAGKNTTAGNVGIQLRNSISSTNVPVILVSDGKVVLENLNAGFDDYTIAYASIFANGVELHGLDNNFRLTMNHVVGSPLDQTLIPALFNAGALPNPSANGGAMSLVPGTWRQASN